jgi:hypothetical protein
MSLSDFLGPGEQASEGAQGVGYRTHYVFTIDETSPTHRLLEITEPTMGPRISLEGDVRLRVLGGTGILHHLDLAIPPLSAANQDRFERSSLGTPETQGLISLPSQEMMLGVRFNTRGPDGATTAPMQAGSPPRTIGQETAYWFHKGTPRLWVAETAPELSTIIPLPTQRYPSV